MSDTITPGLDQVPTTSTPQAGIPLKGVKVPGMGVVSGTTLMTGGDEVLQNMQKLINEKYGGINTYLNPIVGGLKDSAAILAGGNAMTARDAEKRAEMQQLLEMQNAMVGIRSQQTQQQRFMEQRDKDLGITSAAQPGAQPGAQPRPAAAAPAEGSIAQMVAQFPEMREALSRAKSDDEYNVIIRDFTKKIVEQKAQTAFGPTSTEMVEMPIGDKMVPMTRAQASKLAQSNPIVAEALKNISGGAPVQGAPVQGATVQGAPGTISPQNIGYVESRNRPGAVGPNVPGQGSAVGEMQTMPATLRDPGYGVKSAQLTGDKVKDEAESKRVGTEYFNALKAKHGDTLAAAAYVWGPGKLENWLASGADISKLPADVKDYVAKAHLTSAIQNRPGTTQAAVTPAAVTPGTTEQPPMAKMRAETKNVFGDKAAIAAKHELEKSNAIESGKANIKNIQEEEAKLLNRTEPFELQNREGNNQYLGNLVKQWGGNERVAGILNKPGWGNAFANALETGIRTPVGELSLPSIEASILRTAPKATKEEIEANKEIARIMGQRILDVVQRSKGSSSDRDWVAFRQIAGTSSNGWDAINRIQKYDQAALNLDKQDRELYNKTYNGQTFNYAGHSISEERKALLKEYAETLKDINNSKFTSTKVPPRPADVPQGAKFDPEGKKWWWKDAAGNARSN